MKSPRIITNHESKEREDPVNAGFSFILHGLSTHKKKHMISILDLEQTLTFMIIPETIMKRKEEKI